MSCVNTYLHIYIFMVEIIWIGNLGHFCPSDAERVIDQLNGWYHVRGPVHPCPPGGVGATPNACNF